MNTTRLHLACLLLIVPGLVQAGETTVTQSHKAFDPGELHIRAGDAVNFENADDVRHNIQISAESGDTHDAGMQKPGETVAFAFTAPGEYRVHCSIHPRMRMTIRVE